MKNGRSLCGYALMLASAAVLVGCGSVVPSIKAVQDGQFVPQPTPLLALPAQSLGCAFAAQQRLTVFAPNQSPQVLDVMLEVDASMVKLAMVHTGQRIGTIMWDGEKLRSDLSRWWPDVLQPAQVLSDMQLALWPQAVVQQALPEGWGMVENNSVRRLLHQGKERISIQKISVNTIEITYLPAVWRLRIDSVDGSQPCAVAGE